MKVVWYDNLVDANRDVNSYIKARIISKLPPLKIIAGDGGFWIDNPDYDKWTPSFLRLVISTQKKGSTRDVEQVESSKRNGTFYDVIMNGDKAFVCPCDGFKFRGSCRHLAEAELQRKMTKEGLTL